MANENYRNGDKKLPPLEDNNQPKTQMPATCPACEQSLRSSRRCGKCGGKANLTYNSLCENHNKCNGSMVDLPTPDVTFCSPESRLGKWLRKCRVPGRHIHLRCKYCGWSNTYAIKENDQEAT